MVTPASKRQNSYIEQKHNLKEIGMSEAKATHPITASEGRDNAFYHYCNTVEHNSPYASCLNKLHMQADNKMPPVYSECKTAIQAGRCIAESMRDEELGKGVAIYYIPRAEIRAKAEAREKLAAELMEKSASKTASKESKRKSKMGIDPNMEFDVPRTTTAKVVKVEKTEEAVALDFSAQMALAISREAEAMSAKPVAVTPAKQAYEVKFEKTEPVIEGKKSMIEIAREMAAKRKAEQASL